MFLQNRRLAFFLKEMEVMPKFHYLSPQKKGGVKDIDRVSSRTGNAVLRALYERLMESSRSVFSLTCPRWHKSYPCLNLSMYWFYHLVGHSAYYGTTNSNSRTRLLLLIRLERKDKDRKLLSSRRNFYRRSFDCRQKE